LLASKVSEARDIDGAVAAFKEAVKNANGQNPKEIHTDAMRAYREWISQNFKEVDHIA
jgi:transposase-like protein